jgi:VWFA-related protein
MADIARDCFWPIGLIVAAALGAGGVVQSRQAPPVLAGDELVRITVGVERSNGSHVRGLKAEDFDVASDGQARPMQYFSAADEPGAIVFLTDETASMPGRGNLRMDAAIDGALLLRRTPRDRIRVGGFARSLVLSPRFDTEWPELHRAASLVRDIPAADRAGPSPLWDGADTAVKALEAEPGRRAILMITDGRSTGNVHSVDEVMHHAIAANVSINVVAVPSVTTVAQNRMTYARMRPYIQLEQMARATGGAYAEMGEFPDLAPLLVRGITRLHELYTIGFPPAVLDGREHGLAVRVKQTGVRVRVKTGYVAGMPRQIPRP